MIRTASDLKQLQSLPLSAKVILTKQRIREWHEHYDGQVYVSFSGGKDSSVLLNIAREICPDIEAVFVNTGLEYPEIQQFVKTFENVTILRPKMRFDEVIKKYGYPMISKDVSQAIHYAKQNNAAWAWKKLNGISSKVDEPSQYREQRYRKYKPLAQVDFNISNWCCLVMKEKPLREIEKNKKPIVGMLAEESERRTDAWLKTGCNAFDSKRPMSKPMSFWTEQNVLQYIKENNLPIASVYGDIVYASEPDQYRMEDYGLEDCGTERLATTGCDRTGCIFCGFGCHLDKEPSRFQRLKQTHPRQYAYCMGGGEYGADGIWRPNKDGLGMRHVFEELNKIYGDDFIRYE